MMSFSRLIRDYLWPVADGDGTLFLITTLSKSSTGLYCPCFELCGDESVPVSRSSFRTRKTVLLLTPVA